MSMIESFFLSNGREEPVSIISSLRDEHRSVSDWNSFSKRKSNVGVVIAPSARFTYNALFDAIGMVRSIPVSIDVIYAIPREEMYIGDLPGKCDAIPNVVDKVLSHEGNMVLFDETGRRDALIPKDAILVEESQVSIPDASALDLDIGGRKRETRILSDVLFVQESILGGEEPIKSAYAGVEDHIRDSFTLITGGRCEFPLTASELADVCNVIAENDVTLYHSELMGRGCKCLVFDEETTRHVNKLREMYELAHFAKHAIHKTLRDAHVPFNFDTSFGEVHLNSESKRKVHRMGIDPAMAFLDSLGVYTLIDAYLDGIPEEDILA